MNSGKLPDKLKFLKGWDNIALIIKIYALAILFFFVFRLILFLTGLENINGISSNLPDIINAFFMGIRFDVVISGYLLLLPFLILTVSILQASAIMLYINRFSS